MSGSVIGALRVNLGLDSAQFERGAGKAVSALGSMRAQFLAVAGVATALGAAITGMAIKGANDIDRLVKGARRIEGTANALQALELAAGEAGVSVSSLVNDVQTMNREVASGAAGAIRSLDRLGLSAAEFQQLDADDRIATIADRVKELGLSAGDATALLRDLGIRNKEMALLMLQGGDAIRAARNDIREYGLEIDDALGAKIERANDQIGRLGIVSQYLGQRLAAEVVPVLGAFAQAITDSMREGGMLRMTIDLLIDNLGTLGQAFVIIASASAARYVAAMLAATTQTGLLTVALGVARGAVLALGGPFGILWGVLGGAAAALILFRENAETAVPIMDSAQDAIDKLNNVLLTSSEKTLPEAARATLNLTNENIKLARSAYEAARAEIAKANAAAQYAQTELGLQQAFSPTGQPTQAERDLAAAIARLTKANADLAAAEADLTARINEGQLALSEATSGMAEHQNRTVNLKTEIEGLNDALNRVSGGGAGASGGGAPAAANALEALGLAAEQASESAKQLEASFESAFVDFVTGARSAQQAAQQLLQQLARLVAQSAFRSLLGGFSSGGGGLISSLFGGAPSFAGGGFTGFGSRTGGLDGLGGFPAILHPNETVIDHTKRSAGGQTVIRLELSEGLRAEILAEAAQQGVEIVQGFSERGLPARMAQINQDARRR